MELPPPTYRPTSPAAYAHPPSTSRNALALKQSLATKAPAAPRAIVAIATRSPT